MFENKYPIYIIIHIQKTGGTTMNVHLKNNLKKEEALFLYKRRGFFNIVKNKYEYVKSDSQINSYLSSLTEYQKNKIKIIMGHEVYYGMHKFFNRPFRYIIFLREPLKRAVSNYKQQRNVALLPQNTIIKDHLSTLDFKPPKKTARKNIIKNTKILSFKEWLKTTGQKNFMTKLLMQKGFLKNKPIINATKKDIKKTIEKFYFIGLLESFEEDFPLLCGELKIKKSGEKHNVSKNFKIELTQKTIKEFRKNNLDYILYTMAVEFNKQFKNNNPDFISANKTKTTLVSSIKNLTKLLNISPTK